MTREGAVEVNAATGKKKRISKRIRDADFVKTEAPQQPEQAAQTIPGGRLHPLWARSHFGILTVPMSSHWR